MMTPKTQVKTPLEIDQEVTLNSSFDWLWVAVTIVLAALMISLSTLSSSPAKPADTHQQFASEAATPRPEGLTEFDGPAGEDALLPPLGPPQQGGGRGGGIWGARDGEGAEMNAALPSFLSHPERRQPVEAAMVERGPSGLAMEPAMGEAPEALVQRVYIELWNQGDLSAADELFAPDFQGHETELPLMPRRILSPAGVRSLATLYRSAFSDLTYTVEDIIAEGDRVVVRWRASGTHRGTFYGRPPTGAQVAWGGITIWRIAEGQIVEAWVNQDGPDFREYSH